MPTLITLGSVSAKGLGFSTGSLQTYWVNKLDTMSSGWSNNGYGGLYVNANNIYAAGYNQNSTIPAGMVFDQSGINTSDWTTATSGAYYMSPVASNYNTSSIYTFPVFGSANNSIFYNKSTDGKNFTSYTILPTGETLSGIQYVKACPIDASSQFVTFNASTLGRAYYTKTTGTTLNWSVYVASAGGILTYYDCGTVASGVAHTTISQGATTYSVGFNATTGAISYQKSLSFTGSLYHSIFNSMAIGSNIYKYGYVYNASSVPKTLIAKFDTTGGVVWAKRIAFQAPSTQDIGSISKNTGCFDLITGSTYFVLSTDGLNFYIAGVNSSGTFINGLKITFSAGNPSDGSNCQVAVTSDAVYFWITQYYAPQKTAWLFKLPKNLAISGTYTGFTISSASLTEDATLTASTAVSSLTFTSETSPVVSVAATLSAGGASYSPVKTNL